MKDQEKTFMHLSDAFFQSDKSGTKAICQQYLQYTMAGLLDKQIRNQAREQEKCTEEKEVVFVRKYIGLKVWGGQVFAEDASSAAS